MSYHTLSFITTCNCKQETAQLQEEFKQMHPSPQVRNIIHPFKGVVAQYDLRELEDEIDTDVLKEQIVGFSKQHPGKKFASIEVDCFGGKCDSWGKIWQNGNVISEEDDDHIAHIKLLKQLSDEYKSWHFEPFTREYFTKKGGIWGQITGEEFKYFGIGIYTSYNGKPGYRCDMTVNELILEKQGKFYIYLMEPMENCIKVLGSVLDDSDDTLSELKQVIQEEILYTDSYLFIELFDREEVLPMENIETERVEKLYRYKAFNEQTFSFSEDGGGDEPPSPEVQPEAEKTSFWQRLKNMFS